MRPLPTILAVLIALTSRTAFADEPPAVAVLDYENSSSDASCPSEQEFRDRVVARLGKDPFVPAADRTIVVTLRDDQGSVRAEIRRVEGGASAARVRGRRELRAPRRECSELGDSIAVAVSVILDPRGARATPTAPPSLPDLAASRSSDEEAGASRPPRPDTVAAEPSAGGASPVPAQPTPWSPTFEVGPQMSLGRAPGPTAGGRLAASIGTSGWGIGLEGMVESTFGLTTLEAERFRALVGAAGPVVCRRVASFFGCVVSTLGVIEGELSDIDAPTTRHTLLATVGARIGVVLRASKHVSLEPSLDVLASLIRTRVQFEGGALWYAPPVLGTLGIMLRLGS